MNQKLKVVIENYLSAVNEAIDLLVASGIELPKSNMEWALSGIIQCGQLKDGIKYFKHGFGCAVHLSSGVVDFDFGPKGEYNGFDAWRLWGFLQSSKLQNIFTSELELKHEFSRAIECGAVMSFGTTLYFLNEKNA